MTQQGVTMEEKVNYYYNRMLDIRNNLGYYKKVKSLSNNTVNIKMVLKEIIDNNLEYLLTDGFLFYIISISLVHPENFRNSLFLRLCDLTNKDLLLERYGDYVSVLSFGFCKYNVATYDANFRIIILKEGMNDDERKIIEDYELSRLMIECNKDIYEDEYVLLKYIFLTIASYCLINKCIDKYKEWVTPYISDTKSKLEELRLHGLYIEPRYENVAFDECDPFKEKDLRDYVVSNLDNGEKNIKKVLS